MVLMDLCIGIPNRLDIAMTGAFWGLIYVWMKMPNKWAMIGSFAQLLLVAGLIIVSYVNIKYDGCTMVDSLGMAQLWLMSAHLSNVSFKPYDQPILTIIVRLVTIVVAGVVIYDCFIPFLHVSIFVPLFFFIFIRVIICLHNIIKRALKEGN